MKPSAHSCLELLVVHGIVVVVLVDLAADGSVKFVLLQISPFACTCWLEVSVGPVTSKPMSLKFSVLIMSCLLGCGIPPDVGKFIP